MLARSLIVAWVVAAACTHGRTAPPPLPLANVQPEPAIPAPPLGELLAKATSRVLAIDDRLYAVGSGPVLISRDRGATFAPWSAPANLCASMVVGAGTHLYAVAARCSATDVRTSPDELYRSFDGGDTWDDVGLTTAILRGVDARDPRVVYADTSCGSSNRQLCRSDDAGVTWQPMTVPAASPAYAMLTGRLFVADTGSLFYAPPRDTRYELDRSDDRGATWRAVVTADAPADLAIEAVLADGSLVGQDLDHCRIVRSVSGGPFTTVLEPATCEPGTAIAGTGMYACAVIADDQVMASRDSGATWRAVAMPPRGQALRYACYATRDRVLVGAGDRLDGLAPPW
nr:hypothetical protein [Kofleriaceae bacterium]